MHIYQESGSFDISLFYPNVSIWFVDFSPTPAASDHPVYFYEFSHRPAYVRSKRPRWHAGCDHTNDLQFFWGVPFLNSHAKCNATYTATEITFTKNTMAYYANFIKNG